MLYTAEARDWEDGCVADTIRNQFIVPRLTELVGSVRPARILDLGAATGYIAREVDRALPYRPHWLIVDSDTARLSLARELCAANMNCSYFTTDISRIAATGDVDQVDLIVLSFTLLEIIEKGQVLDQLPDLLSENGYVFIVMPDPWEEVIKAHDAQRCDIDALVAQQVSLRKIDQFTGREYPFHLIRIETLICLMTKRGFNLISLDRGGERGQAFCMIFRIAPGVAKHG